MTDQDLKPSEQQEEEWKKKQEEIEKKVNEIKEMVEKMKKEHEVQKAAFYLQKWKMIWETQYEEIKKTDILTKFDEREVLEELDKQQGDIQKTLDALNTRPAKQPEAAKEEKK